MPVVHGTCVAPETLSPRGGARFHLDAGHHPLCPLVPRCHHAGPVSTKLSPAAQEPAQLHAPPLLDRFSCHAGPLRDGEAGRHAPRAIIPIKPAPGRPARPTTACGVAVPSAPEVSGPGSAWPGRWSPAPAASAATSSGSPGSRPAVPASRIAGAAPASRRPGSPGGAPRARPRPAPPASAGAVAPRPPAGRDRHTRGAGARRRPAPRRRYGAQSHLASYPPWGSPR